MLRFKLKNLLKGILNYLRISRKILKVMGGLLIVSIWIFPPSSLSLAEKGLRELSGVNVELKNLDPLVHRAIAATSVVPDLRGILNYLRISRKILKVMGGLLIVSSILKPPLQFTRSVASTTSSSSRCLSTGTGC
ncbi:uncharacterized protein LOC115714473 isoform X2 [Cannabis sativa]|uniref:uncharacterized protein LOC115714473 isoform X2 n=1 Tax=Cannabis sativa TaxID=3483 RepID=UPI0029C9DC68|nr:uncharacterized protein LOC115714473 isoform X2 [Cannabis sativa]